MRIDAIWEHTKQPIANHHHNIINDMDLLDGDRVFEIPHETVLFFDRFVYYLCGYGFNAVWE